MLRWVLWMTIGRRIAEHAYEHIMATPYSSFGPRDSYSAWLAYQEARGIFERIGTWKFS